MTANLIPNILEYDETPKPDESSHPNPFKVLSYEGLESAEPPPPLFYIEYQTRDLSFIPRGKVGVIGGFGGSGKSMAVMHLALSIASGKNTLMRCYNGGVLMPNPVTHKVALLFGEEDEAGCLYRLKCQLDKMNLRGNYHSFINNLKIIPLATAGDVSLVHGRNRDETGMEPEHRYKLLEKTLIEASPDGYDLIVVDPLSHFGGLDFENDNGMAVRLMRKLTQLTTLKGSPTVLGVHHSPKGAKNNRLDDALRGSSALKDNSRWVGIIRRINEDTEGLTSMTTSQGHRVIELVTAKTNYTEPAQRVRFALDKGSITAITELKLLDPTKDQEQTTNGNNASKRGGNSGSRNVR